MRPLNQPHHGHSSVPDPWKSQWTHQSSSRKWFRKFFERVGEIWALTGSTTPWSTLKNNIEENKLEICITYI